MIIYTDGACKGNPGPMGVGIIIGDKEISKYLGKGTNNTAELTAIKIALEEAKKLELNEFELRSDSEWSVKILNGEYKCKQPHLCKILTEINILRKNMKIKFTWIDRSQNAKADQLANEAIEKHRQSGGMN